MNINDTRALLARILADIAPEAELAEVGEDEDLRQALDLDSMDFLNVVVGLHEHLAIGLQRHRAFGLAAGGVDRDVRVRREAVAVVVAQVLPPTHRHDGAVLLLARRHAELVPLVGADRRLDLG